MDYEELKTEIFNVIAEYGDVADATNRVMEVIRERVQPVLVERDGLAASVDRAAKYAAAWRHQTWAQVVLEKLEVNR